MRRWSLRWKLAATYCMVTLSVLATINFLLLRSLETDYLKGREASYLAHANIMALTGQDTIERHDRSTFYFARDYSRQLGARVLVLDGGGRVTTDSYGEAWLEGRLLRHAEVLSALGGQSAAAVHMLDTGERVLYVTVPVLEAETVTAVIMLVVGLEDIYAALAQIRQRLLLVSLGSGLVVTLLAWFLARLLTGPLRELTAAAQALARGRMEQRVSVRGSDEIGELAAAFNLMSAELEKVDHTRRQFFADASHELKSPLATIKTLAESLLLSQERDTAAYRECLEDIDNQVNRLSCLVDDLLRIAKLEDTGLPLVISEEDAGLLVRETVDTVRCYAQAKGVALSVQGGGQIVWPVNAELLRRILLNLLDNAIRHTPGGGKVAVGIRVEEDAKVGGTHLVLEVADTGEGIAAEALPRIFDRFYRVDRARARSTGGTGLGLAIVHQAVQRLGGSVSAASVPGEGSTFTVRLPKS